MQDTFSTPVEGPGPIFWIVCAVLIVFEIASLWKVFEKTGRPDWAPRTEPSPSEPGARAGSVRR